MFSKDRVLPNVNLYSLDVLKKEIEWCKANRGKSGKSEEFELGFIAGLQQAILLMNKVAEATVNEIR